MNFSFPQFKLKWHTTVIYALTSKSYLQTYPCKFIVGFEMTLLFMLESFLCLGLYKLKVRSSHPRWMCAWMYSIRSFCLLKCCSFFFTFIWEKPLRLLNACWWCCYRLRFLDHLLSSYLPDLQGTQSLCTYNIVMVSVSWFPINSSKDSQHILQNKTHKSISPLYRLV